MVWRLSSQPNMRARRAELVISTIRLFLINLRQKGCSWLQPDLAGSIPRRAPLGVATAAPAQTLRHPLPTAILATTLHDEKKHRKPSASPHRMYTQKAATMKKNHCCIPFKTSR